ncbi:MAG: WecB/TagA/CpsF family glycosyltransferase [Candidatus Eremiobacteraeota bacterium]|nr:WecB/TagA/CpsF family glycosyltransferase [Candidatus Eremiobacteraeota bacterium]
MESIRILGCRVDAVGRDAAVERVVALAHGSAPSLVVTLGTEMVMEARRSPRFRDVVERAGLVVCDTVGLLLASRFRGGPLRERVTGVALLAALARRPSSDGLRLFLLGGRADTAERAAAVLRAQGATVVGTHDGYFAPERNESVAAEIKRTGANVVLAALGSPKQELWLADNLAATGAVVGLGVGGTFDILAGNVRRAPAALQKMGLEWLYRLVREPRRWRRQLALPAFAVLALRESAAMRVLRGKSTS